MAKLKGTSQFFNIVDTVLAVLCFSSQIYTIHGYGTGAGQSSCTRLVPGHCCKSSKASPYTISLVGEVTTYKSQTPITGIFVLFIYF